MFYFFFYCHVDHRDLLSFPTRRSSDLQRVLIRDQPLCKTQAVWRVFASDRGGCKECGQDRLHLLAGLVVLRSEEHTSELQSQSNLVCRLLLEKKNQFSYVRSYAQSCCR